MTLSSLSVAYSGNSDVAPPLAPRGEGGAFGFAGHLKTELRKDSPKTSDKGAKATTQDAAAQTATVSPVFVPQFGISIDRKTSASQSNPPSQDAAGAADTPPSAIASLPDLLNTNGTVPAPQPSANAPRPLRGGVGFQLPSAPASLSVSVPAQGVTAEEAAATQESELAFAAQIQKPVPGSSVPGHLPEVPGQVQLRPTAAISKNDRSGIAGTDISKDALPEGPKVQAADSSAQMSAHSSGKQDSQDKEKSAPKKETPVIAEQSANPRLATNDAPVHAETIASRRTGESVTSAKERVGSEPATALEPQTAPTKPSGPMKDLSLQVQSISGQKVDVRIVERSGDLHVAVRANDSEDTRNLRQGLPDLTNRLAENGFHTNTWRPSQAGIASEAATPTRDSSKQSPQGESQSNSGASQQDRGQRQNNSSNRPRWVQELDSNLAGKSESTGLSHGLIN